MPLTPGVRQAVDQATQSIHFLNINEHKAALWS
jgi:hypothetical protein